MKIYNTYLRNSKGTQKENKETKKKKKIPL